MPTLRNVNSFGDVHIHKVGFVLAGETFETSEAHATELLKQAGNFELVTDKTPAKKKG